jgi:hypothetical protein
MIPKSLAQYTKSLPAMLPARKSPVTMPLFVGLCVRHQYADPFQI